MAILKLIGFGATMIGLSGMAEGDNFPVALTILLFGVITLGIDSLMEDFKFARRKSRKKAKKKLDSKCTYIGTTASYPSYLRAGRQ